jgi:hypothetical protein
MAQQWVTGSPDGTFLTRQPPTSLTPHRSAPALSPYYVKGRGASDPLRGLRPWSFAGAGPEVPAWSRHTTASAAKTGIVYHVPVAPAWRPPGQSVGLHVPFEHRRPPPPPPPRLPPPSDPAQGDLSTEVLTAELRKTTAILAKAHAQLHVSLQVSPYVSLETFHVSLETFLSVSRIRFVHCFAQDLCARAASLLPHRNQRRGVGMSAAGTHTHTERERERERETDTQTHRHTDTDTPQSPRAGRKTRRQRHAHPRCQRRHALARP